MTEPFTFRVKPESRRRWQTAADQAKRKLSDWMRVTLDEAAGTAGVVVVDERPDEGGTPEVLSEMVPGPSEPRQAPDLATDVPVPAISTDESPEMIAERLAEQQAERRLREHVAASTKLAPNCVNVAMHWRLQRHEKCTYCHGHA